MPMPWTYRQASREFRAYLDDAKARMGLDSDNMAYTATDAVFRVFRRRLTAQQGLDFATALPAVLRAIFVQDWRPEPDPPPFASRAEMAREAQALRPDHNLTPPDAIEAVAWAVRRQVRPPDFERALATMPEGSAAFWAVEGVDPETLGPRIV